jgi:hypothetical protein
MSKEITSINSTLTCPQGTTLNSSRTSCDTKPTITCPTGTTYNSYNSICSSTPNPICPPETKLDSNSYNSMCTADPVISCPPDTILGKNKCYKCPDMYTGTKIDNNIVCIGIPHGQRPAIEGTPDLEATVEHPGMKGIPASSAIIGTCKYGILTPSYSNESCLQPSCEIEPSNDLPKCKILISAE